jgi:hypothetical protein
MHLLNAETDVSWELLATDNPPVLDYFSVVVLRPSGVKEFITSPFSAADYVAPTETVVGTLAWKITPTQEGMWKIRLVTGTADDYTVISRVEMFVFDNTTMTIPYNEAIGTTLPYDINFYMQGLLVPQELFGVFIATRVMKVKGTTDIHVAYAQSESLHTEVELIIMHNEVDVGNVKFAALSKVGVVTIPQLLLHRGDRLQVRTAQVLDQRIGDISINIAALATVVSE